MPKDTDKDYSHIEMDEADLEMDEESDTMNNPHSSALPQQQSTPIFAEKPNILELAQASKSNNKLKEVNFGKGDSIVSASISPSLISHF